MRVIVLFTVFLWNTAFGFHFSPMSEEWEKHKYLPWDPDPPIPFVVAKPMSGKVKVKVMGYLPYWQFGNVKLHLDMLDIIAYFGAELNSDGSLGNPHHWGTSKMASLIDLAHEKDVLVVLTITNFNKNSIHSFLSNQSAVKNGIENMVDLVVNNGGDGINIDFEGMAPEDKDLFVDFISKLKTAFDLALGQSHVSIATPAVNWSKSFDYAKLAQISDALFIMGYNYHWSGGQPGPVAPLVGGGKWGKYSLEWTVEDYINNGGSENKDKFILGLPLYGIKWQTQDFQVPSKSLGDGKAIFMESCLEEGDKYGWLWDQDSQTTYYMYQADTWYQCWCDTVVSHMLKFDLVSQTNIGGVGFWALGYEGEADDLWFALQQVFGYPIETEPPSTETTQQYEVFVEDNEEILLSEEIISHEKWEETIKESYEDVLLIDIPLHEQIDQAPPTELVSRHSESGCNMGYTRSFFTLLVFLLMLIRRKGVG